LKNFSPFRIFEQLCACPEKQCALKIFTVLNILFTIRIFDQLALALKIEFALKFFNPGGCRPPASYAYALPRYLCMTAKIEWF